MYTELALELELSPAGFERVRRLHEIRKEPHRTFDCFGFTAPTTWGKLALEHPEFSGWAEVGRCDFIPFGGSAYFKERYSEVFVDRDRPLWTFRCNLKDYEREIPRFLLTVVPLLDARILSGHVWYEEDERPTEIKEYLRNLCM
jgi:hypothetical protein